MRRIFKKVKRGLTFKVDLPPPYEESADRIPSPNEENSASIDQNNCQVFDLLEACKISNTNEDLYTLSESETLPQIAAADGDTMGLKYSTPWGAHKSKISLTWVLRDQSDTHKRVSRERRPYYDDFRVKCAGNSNQYNGRLEHPKSDRKLGQLNSNRRFEYELDENSNDRRWRRNDVTKVNNARIVGRNALYNDLKYSVNSEISAETSESSEATSVAVSESDRNRSRRHRCRRRRRQDKSLFGYEIKNIDCFLAEASIDQPGNIPVVLSCPSILYQTHNGLQKEMSLPLGTVVNAVFKNQDWLYVQTPHAEEGYIKYSACLPLGIIPNVKKSNSPWHKTPCWESSTDIYPRPCGNMTDTEKENLRGRTRSESGYRVKNNHNRLKSAKSVCGEEAFDKLFLKATSVSSLKNLRFDVEEKARDIDCDGRKNRNTEPDNRPITRQTLLVINKDYTGNLVSKTLSVNQGDVVILIQGSGAEADVDAEWFYVRKRNGAEGFIPAEIAGHGYI